MNISNTQPEYFTLEATKPLEATKTEQTCLETVSKHVLALIGLLHLLSVERLLYTKLSTKCLQKKI